MRRTTKRAVIVIVFLRIAFFLSIEKKKLKRYAGIEQQVNNTSFNVKSACHGTPVTHFVDRGIPSDKNMSLSKFLRGPGLERANSSSVAVCHFQRNRQNHHFPHTMETLLSCWSWWQANPDKQAILIWPKDFKFFLDWKFPIRSAFRKGFRRGRSFNTGVLETMRTLGVDIILEDDKKLGGDNVLADVVYSARSMHRPFAMQTTSHIAVLRDGTLSHLGLRPMAGCPVATKGYDNETIQQQPKAQPRIGILNRDRISKRKLLNHRLLASLGREFHLEQQIPVAYFEHASFEQQVSFFSSLDIVLSPHGAQLTGLWYLPRCGAVLELFPRGYYQPDYFGMLCDVTAVRHYSAYVSQDGEESLEKEVAEGMLTTETRVKARNTNLCPNHKQIAQVLQKMIQDWRECCQTSGLASSASV